MGLNYEKMYFEVLKVSLEKIQKKEEMTEMTSKKVQAFHG